MFRYQTISNLRRISPLVNYRFLSSQSEDLLSKTFNFIPRSIDLIDSKLKNLEQQTTELNRKTENIKQRSEQNASRFTELIERVDKNKTTQEKIKQKERELEKVIETKFKYFEDKIELLEQEQIQEFEKIRCDYEELRSRIDNLIEHDKHRMTNIEEQVHKEREDRDVLLDVIPLLIKMALRPDLETTTKLVKLGVELSKDEKIRQQLEGFSVPNIPGTFKKVNIPSLPSIGFNDFTKNMK